MAPAATTSPTSFPQLPSFVPDPSDPTCASTWLQQVGMKFSLSGTLTAQQKIALVASTLDTATFKRVSRALLPDDIATYADWDKFKTAFINLFDVKRSLFANRYDAFQIEWLGPAHESLQEYVARVRQTAASFDCANFSANELSTLLVLMGMKAPALESLRSLAHNALIKTPKETLDNISTLLDNALLTDRDQKLPEQSRVHYVKKTDPRPQRSSSPASSVASRSSAASSTSKQGLCNSCGGRHRRSTCKYRDAKCYSCGTPGHISKACKKKKGSSSSTDTPKHRGSQKSSRSSNKIGFLQTASLRTFNSSAARISVDILIDGKPLHIQYDSGSDVTLFSRRDHKKIGSPFLNKSVVRARDVNLKPVPLDGCFKASITYMGCCKSVTIYVADIADSLLGLDYCNKVTLLPSPSTDTFVAKVSSSTVIPTAASFATTSASTATTSAARYSTSVPSSYNSSASSSHTYFAPVDANAGHTSAASNDTSSSSTSTSTSASSTAAHSARVKCAPTSTASRNTTVTSFHRGDRIRHYDKDFDAWVTGNVIENFNGMVTIKLGTSYAMKPVSDIRLVSYASSNRDPGFVPASKQKERKAPQ